MDLRLRPLRFRDRRFAAADQLWDDHDSSDALGVARGRILAPMGDDERRDYLRTHRGPRYIYSWRSLPFRDPTERGDLQRLIEHERANIPTRGITRIVLHQTTGAALTEADLPGRETDAQVESHHRVDEIIAHFVVMQDGTVVYTHDVAFGLNDAGATHGIDIEFAGRFPGDPEHTTVRLSEDAILAGRALIYCLKDHIPSITRIHPHGQLQAAKRRSCPGPDVWVNVGMWALDHPVMGLSSESSERIDPAQENRSYDQRVTRQPQLGLMIAGESEPTEFIDPWL